MAVAWPHYAAIAVLPRAAKAPCHHSYLSSYISTATVPVSLVGPVGPRATPPFLRAGTGANLPGARILSNAPGNIQRPTVTGNLLAQCGRFGR